MANGLFGVPNIRNQMIQRAFAPDTRPQPAPVKKPGLFGQGGIGRAIAGTLGDVLLQRGGNAPIYQPMQQYRQALADKLRMASLDRQNDMQDWLAKQQWERANPKSQEPDAFERALAGAGVNPASPEGQQLYRQRAESMARDPLDEFVVVPIPGRGTYAGPRSGLAEAMGQVPTRPVGRLTPITTENTPPPQLSANGFPTTLTRAQYQAVVNAKGQAATDEWARRNNIVVRD